MVRPQIIKLQTIKCFSYLPSHFIISFTCESLNISQHYFYAYIFDMRSLVRQKMLDENV